MEESEEESAVKRQPGPKHAQLANPQDGREESASDYHVKGEIILAVRVAVTHSDARKRRSANVRQSDSPRPFLGVPQIMLPRLESCCFLAPVIPPVQ